MEQFQIKTGYGRVISLQSIKDESGGGVILETSDAIGTSCMTKTCLSWDEAMQIRDALTELLN